MFTDRAHRLIQRVHEKHRSLYLVLDDTGCCGFSNAFLKATSPGPAYQKLLENKSVEVYAHPRYLKTAETFRELVVDSVADPVEDSFSLETQFGERLVVSLVA